MATNRLYLVDDETGDAIMLAKGFGDWSLRASETLIQAFLEAHDFEGASGGPSTLRLATDDDDVVGTKCQLGQMWKLELPEEE